MTAMSALAASDLGGDLSALRTQNARRVLAVLLASPNGLTASEIAGATDLSRSTVVSLLDELLGPVLSSSHNPPGAPRGRRGRTWLVEPKSFCSVGVDLGRSHYSVGATDPFGLPVAEPSSIRRPLGEAAHPYLTEVSEAIKRFLDQNGIACSDVGCLTVGFPGAVGMTGVINEPDLGDWSGLNLRHEIVERWPIEPPPATYADDNANLAALAECRLGAGRGAESALYLKWSTGVGSAVVVGSSVWRGHAGLAGTVAHLPVTVTPAEAHALDLGEVSARRTCPRCRQVDCLEVLVGASRVAEAAGLPDLGAVIQAALESSSQRHQIALDALKAAARLVGKAVGGTLTLLDVERIVVGGLIGRELYPALADELRQGIAMTSLPMSHVDLRMGKLGAGASVRGAAVMGIEQHGVNLLLAKAGALRTT